MKPLALRAILAATDLSDRGLPALRTARELAGLSGARLHIVYAGEQHPNESVVTQHLAAAGLKPGDLEFEAMIGPAGALISQEATRTEADVIVLGQHRRGRTGGLGSTAYRVVQTAAAPVLVLPVPLELPLNNVLVAIDMSPATQGSVAIALTWASALRRRKQKTDESGTQLEILYVEPDEQSEHADLQSEFAAVSERTAGIASVILRKHVERSRDPADAIAKRATVIGANVVVVGTRARRTDGHPLGSVSKALITEAAVPILLVPPELWAHEQ
jgi:nucleotide-binding universal stress UspA family protein